jgi:site-specific DNA recombinase
MDGYIRVSRRAGREGESFISPEVQRKRIDEWAGSHEVEIVHWWEELDQSGAKRDRPMFQEALARCERAETGGMVVARLDRFARSAVDALESIKRLNDAGARLVSVEDGFDGSTAMGRFAIGILTLIAELELERIRDNWAVAIKEAVGRGVHIAPQTPTGYQRGEGGRLIPDPVASPVITEAFRMRAAGVPVTKVAEFLEERGVGPSSGGPHWSFTGVRNLLRNPVYLGQARSGKVINDQAHEPLVTQAEFDAVRQTRTRFEPRPNSVAEHALLGGLLRCAGCGHSLKISGTRRAGVVYPNYYCQRRFGKGICPSPASISARRIDAYVAEQVLAALRAEDGFFAQAVQASKEVEQTQRRVAQAEHELDQFITDPELLTLLGRSKFLRGVEARQCALDQARVELDTLRSHSSLAEELTSGNLLQAWPDLTIQEKRQLLHGLLDRIVVQADPNSRSKENALPISQRVQIVLRGNVLLTDPE